eukprot:CAMPEP_0171551768 /NCGR_PEP_ID=MMETSP0960-20121227/7915_1 /TAXON_ID=87120 /ORGANISM="Aurantiochytrium limacinum, Strain ATCCMYA-1381" /LENGTH=453 /DNA_ID=CAMNT_0012101075 /DNA_START=93 /DNA_END=1451 /DNA_ORIENTATION=+
MYVFALIVGLLSLVRESDAEATSEAFYFGSSTLTAYDRSDGDYFGSSVGTTVQHAIIGAPRESDGAGAAYVFSRSDMRNAWDGGYKIESIEGFTGLGTSIATDGQSAVIGLEGGVASYFDDGDGTFELEQSIAASDIGADASAGFGFDVALEDRSLLVVSERQSVDRHVYAFSWDTSANRWNTSPTLLKFGSGNSSGLAENIHVAVSNGRVLVSFYDSKTAAVVFSYDSTTLAWAAQRVDLPDKTAGFSVTLYDNPSAASGHAIGFDGDYFAVGLPTLSYVVVYRWDTQNWIVNSLLETPFKGEQSFGQAVSLSDNWLVIGAPQASNGDGFPVGKTYLFTRDTGAESWTRSGDFTVSTAEGGVTGDLFGGAVGTRSGTLVIGATGSSNGAGAVYSFDSDTPQPTLSPTPWPTRAPTLEPTAAPVPTLEPTPQPTGAPTEQHTSISAGAIAGAV